MTAGQAREVHFAGAELGRLQRHVCAIFDDAGAARTAIEDFILQGLANGEQVVEVAEMPRAVIDGLARRTDVQAALDSGQLEVRPWTDAYLAGGRFSASRMLAYMRRLVREADSDRWAGFRCVGTMDWAVESLEGVDELLAYEIGLNRILARPRVTVLCVYDASRHPPEGLEAVVAAHDAALVEGELRRTAARALSPRGRILQAAGVLFAENGVSRTGVDTLIEAAGVAKATFYRHFPAKEDLVLAWLRAPGTQWFDRVKATAEARATAADEVVPRLFDAVGEWLAAEDYTGCPYLNTAVEVANLGAPAAEAIREHLDRINVYLAQVIAATGHPDPASAAQEVHALLAGAISLAVATRSSAHVTAARSAAAQLLGR